MLSGFPYALGALLLVSAGKPEALVRPAPGHHFSLPHSIETSAGRLPLDAKGMAKIAPSVALTDGSLRSYRSAPSGELFYLPTTFTLLRLPIAEQVAPATGRLFVKSRLLKWDTAEVFSIEVETEGSGGLCRFALPPGEWDVALLVPGRSPLLLSGIAVRGSEESLAKAVLRPAAGVRARLRDGKTGAALVRWKAFVHPIGPTADPETADFFERQPVAADQGRLYFSSLPVGAWELTIAAPGYASQRKALSPVVAEATLELGDLFFAKTGSLRVVILFPSERPGDDFTVSVFRNREAGGREVFLSRGVRPQPKTLFSVADIDPGDLIVAFGSRSSGLYREVSVVIEPSRAAAFEISFSPISITGTVLRGEAPVEGVHVRAGRAGYGSDAVSDREGHYVARVWSPGSYILLATPPGSSAPSPEVVIVGEDAGSVEHDILLPANSVFGSVIDAESGAQIPGASISCSRTRPGEPDVAGTALQVTLTSGRDGAYRFDNLANVPVDLSATGKGYAEAVYKSVVPSEVGTEVIIKLRKGIRLRGQVVDEAGNPLVGALVGIDYDPAGNDFADATETSSAGEFEFSQAESGAHLVFAYKCGYRLAAQSLEARDGDASVPTVRLFTSVTPLTIHLQNSRPGAGFRLGISADGVMLPRDYLLLFASRCGRPSRVHATGDLVLDFLPYGSLAAFDLATGRELSVFQNDGLHPVWSIQQPN